MDPEELQSKDSIGLGFVIGFACQLAIVGGIFVVLISAVGPGGLVAIEFWSLFQWIALLPLFVWRARTGYPLQAKGILIAGFLGMLLNVACVGFVLGGLWFG